MAPRLNIVAQGLQAPVRIAVVGASGWIGRAVAGLAAEACGDRLRLFGSGPGDIAIGGETQAVEPLAGAVLGEGEWLIFHCAMSQPHQSHGDMDRFKAVNDAILADVRALADTGDVRRLAYASSGVVGRPHPTGLSLEQQAYRALKADHEAALLDWANDGGPPMVIARVFNLGGPFLTHPWAYALSRMILDAREGRAIEIVTGRPVLRSYAHVSDLALAMLTAAGQAADQVTRFDAAGAQAVELQQLAQLVIEVLGADVEIRRPPMQEGDPDPYLGDPAAFHGWLARAGAEPADMRRIIEDTARGLA